MGLNPPYKLEEVEDDEEEVVRIESGQERNDWVGQHLNETKFAFIQRDEVVFITMMCPPKSENDQENIRYVSLPFGSCLPMPVPVQLQFDEDDIIMKQTMDI